MLVHAPMHQPLPSPDSDWILAAYRNARRRECSYLNAATVFHYVQDRMDDNLIEDMQILNTSDNIYLISYGYCLDNGAAS